jgi:hypothetical protein
MIILTPVVNFINILRRILELFSFQQKITLPNCKQLEVAYKMLIKLRPAGQEGFLRGQGSCWIRQINRYLRRTKCWIARVHFDFLVFLFFFPNRKTHIPGKNGENYLLIFLINVSCQSHFFHKQKVKKSHRYPLVLFYLSWIFIYLWFSH